MSISADMERKPLREPTNDERFAVYHELLALSTQMKLPRGAANSIAEKYGISRSTVYRIKK